MVSKKLVYLLMTHLTVEQQLVIWNPSFSVTDFEVAQLTRFDCTRWVLINS